MKVWLLVINKNRYKFKQFFLIYVVFITGNHINEIKHLKKELFINMNLKTSEKLDTLLGSILIETNLIWLYKYLRQKHYINIMLENLH